MCSVVDSENTVIKSLSKMSLGAGPSAVDVLGAAGKDLKALKDRRSSDSYNAVLLFM